MNNEDVVRKIQAGETELIGDLYLENLPYIRKIVNKYSNDNNYEDLLQESYFGIVEAVKRFDPNRDVSFLSFASYHIKAVLLNYLRCNDSNVYLPSYLAERERAYKAFVNEFAVKHGRNPSIHEIQLNTDLSIEQIKEVEKALVISQGSKSIYDKVMNQTADIEGLRIIDSIIDPDNGIDDLIDDIEKRELSETLWTIVKRLPDNESDIIQYRYNNGASLKVCSQVFGLSTERIRQIEKRGLKRLRTAYRKELQPYLNDYIYQQGLKHTGLRAFKGSFESSVERAVIKLDEKLNRLKKN